MKILFVGTVYPEPADTGKKIVLSGLCRYFLWRFGKSDFMFACIADVPASGNWNSVGLPRPSVPRKILNVLWHTFIKHEKSLQESLLYCRITKNALSDLQRNFQPDLMIFDTIRMGQYAAELKKNKGRKVLYLEDLFSVRYQRMLETFALASRYSFDPLGKFSSNVPKFGVWLVARMQWLQKWLLRFEKFRVEGSENRQVRQFDFSLLISPPEVSFLRERAGCTNVFDLPPYLQTADLRPERTWCGNPEFVFLGSLAYPQNAAAIEHFLSSHFEEVRRRIPGVCIRIIGQHPSAGLIKLASQFGDNVSVEGFVEDLASVLQRCCALIAPLFFGSGVKLKMIDALACGTPIISSNFGVEGIPFESGVHGFCEDRFDRFADAMLSLMDRQLNQRISRCCSDLFHSYYSNDVIRRKYDSYFLDSLSDEFVLAESKNSEIKNI